MDYYKKASDPSPLHSLLSENQTIEFIRYQWLDYSGVLRLRVLTKSHCLELLAEGTHHGISTSALRSITINPSDTWSFLKQELMELQPDWTSLRICHFAPGHAQVMCFGYVKEVPDSLALMRCPRFALARALERCEEFKTSMLFGFEVEFILLNDKLQPLDGLDTGWTWATTAGLRDRKLQFMEEVCRLLEQSNIPVRTFHTEIEPQMEFSTAPFAPMQAIDALLYTHELLRCVALRYGFCATVAPKPTNLDAVDTCHTHFSISGPGDSDNFLAGILSNLPTLIGFSLAHYDSYHAIRNNSGKSGVWVGYGTENRDLPLRRITRNHFEYRPADHTANFYLFIAMLLHFGLDGLDRKTSLDTWQDLRWWPSQMSDKERKEAGLTKRMPTSLQEAVSVLQEYRTLLSEKLGPEVVDAYLAMKEVECGLSMMSDEQRRLRYLRYF